MIDQKQDGTNQPPLQVVTHGSIQVIRVPGEDCGLHGDLSVVVRQVRDLLYIGTKKIAVTFPESAYLYTRSIAALVRCYALVEDAGGTFYIVAPNTHMRHAIKLAGVDAVIKTVESEELLPG